ncbi:hypothetical protein NO995_09205 [Aestuariibaculum sp. M13]|uniref:hypothetical protein n=1 Tax=Aestuariibaculum sp. M13 TaxID=2967132 RepID=UPI002159D545|nr:hypothetical protein [Aestuariibaculum sp. M13]MCR8667857.1 hypothetical protein [Aestuariibaculum sp. M13]
MTLIFATSIVFAQDSIKDFEPLPANSKKLNIVYPNVYWFNSYKIKIPGYGVAKIKENASDTDAIKKQKITISLTDLKNNVVKLEANSIQEYVYSVKTHYLENDVLRILKTGLEVDTEELMIDSIGLKIIEGKVVTNLENLKNWKLSLVKTKNTTPFSELGNLTFGDRTIKMIQSTLESNQNLNQEGNIYQHALFYELIEDGISLGAMAFHGETGIWLKPDLDTSTKLVLCSTLLLLTNF